MLRVRRIYCFWVTPGIWLAYVAAVLVAAVDGGIHPQVLTAAVGGGAVLLLGTLSVALAVWPRQAPAQPLPVGPRRPARVGGRRIGQGMVYPRPAVGVVAASHRPAPRLPSPSEVTGLIVPVVATRPVAVAEAHERTESEGTQEAGPLDVGGAFRGYMRGSTGAPLPDRRDDELHGWVAGALERERDRSEEDPE